MNGNTRDTALSLQWSKRQPVAPHSHKAPFDSSLSPNYTPPPHVAMARLLCELKRSHGRTAREKVQEMQIKLLKRKAKWAQVLERWWRRADKKRRLRQIGERGECCGGCHDHRGEVQGRQREPSTTPTPTPPPEAYEKYEAPTYPESQRVYFHEKGDWNIGRFRSGIREVHFGQWVNID